MRLAKIPTIREELHISKVLNAIVLQVGLLLSDSNVVTGKV